MINNNYLFSSRFTEYLKTQKIENDLEFKSFADTVSNYLESARGSDIDAYERTVSGILPLLQFANPPLETAGYDIYSKHYAISMQLMPAFYSTDTSTYQTLSFDEQINGWVSRYTFKPTALDSLENTYYTMDKGILYKQFDDSVPNRRGYFTINLLTSLM